jgi:hypothetical protein
MYGVLAAEGVPISKAPSGPTETTTFPPPVLNTSSVRVISVVPTRSWALQGEEVARPRNDSTRSPRNALQVTKVIISNLSRQDEFGISVSTSRTSSEAADPDQVVLPCRLLWWQVGFGAPALRAALEHMSVAASGRAGRSRRPRRPASLPQPSTRAA